jgi:hypothetical protein
MYTVCVCIKETTYFSCTGGSSASSMKYLSFETVPLRSSLLDSVWGSLHLNKSLSTVWGPAFKYVPVISRIFHNIFVYVHSAQNANRTFRWKALGIGTHYAERKDISCFVKYFQLLNSSRSAAPFPVLVWRSFNVRFFQTLIFSFISYPLWSSLVPTPPPTLPPTQPSTSMVL